MAAYHHQYQASNAEQNVPQNSTFLLDFLYCSEEHWEEGIREDNFQEEDEVEDNYCSSTPKPISFPRLLEQDVFWDDGELISLFSKEEQNELYESHQPDPYLAGARRGAVEWMLKVNAHHSFSALTAVLAVNYLDRFLLRCPCQGGKPWMTQLAAVACLSLAAKVEETQVPLLLDLQVLLNKSCWTSVKCLCVFCSDSFLLTRFFVLSRSKRVGTYLMPKPFRGWRFWCSQHFSGRWIL